MSSIEEDNVCAKGYGRMELEWVEEMFQGVGWELPRGDEEDVLAKLNDLSLVYDKTGETIINGVIAFAMNKKWKDGGGGITLGLLSDYEHLLSSQPRVNSSKEQCGGASANKSPHHRRNLLRDRSQLTHSGYEDDPMGDDLYLGFQSHQDEEQGEDGEAAGNLGSTVRLQNSRVLYRGSCFAEKRPAVQRVSHPAALSVLSSCLEEKFGFGVDFTRETAEDLIYLEEEEERNEDVGAGAENRSETRLVGAVFPSEGQALVWGNCVLHSLDGPRRVKLDFDGVDGLALFPGKKLVVNGSPSGDQFKVTRVEDRPVPSMAKLDASKANRGGFRALGLVGVRCSAQRLQSSCALASLQLLFAAGPYSASTDASPSEAFKELVQHALRTGADALLLVGPFVPVTATLLKRTQDELFEDYLHVLDDLLGESSLRVLIVPNSATDLCAMPYFPTPPYVPRQAYQTITFLPDPAIFELEGVRIGVSASEILLHLSKRELHRDVAGSATKRQDRMSRLISHIFTSRSLYPLQPSDESIAFSTKGSYDKSALHEIPHVLVLPSILQPSAKVVDQCLVVNPGRFVKGSSTTVRGSFAWLEIDLAKLMGSSSGAQRKSIAEYAGVELVSLRN